MGHSEWRCVSVRGVCIKGRLRVCACVRMWEECALKYECVWVWMWEECAEWGDKSECVNMRGVCFKGRLRVCLCESERSVICGIQWVRVCEWVRSVH